MTDNAPKSTLWGAATAAYQIEGAHETDGRGPSIWDVYTSIPGKTRLGHTGRLACDHYHRTSEDIALMRELNLDTYRLSISWPRVMPAGRGTVNDAGLAFYDRLVDDLLAAGIQPAVTLYHWDLPAALQFELGGWLHDDLPRLFTDYAQTVYDRLGDRVHTWMTINEPWVVTYAGYFDGVHPPGVKDRRQGYRVGHNLLRAHAHAAAACRATIPAARVSYALNTTWSFPATDSPEDADAARRALHDFGGWFGDPPWFGDYPDVMRERLGDLLPAFSGEDARLLRRSIDYVALNYYTSDVVAHAPGKGPLEYDRRFSDDAPRTMMDWPIVPDGFYRLLHWLHERYGNLPIAITENGAACDDQPDPAGFVQDDDRIAYLRNHIGAALKAASEGVNLAGYYVWSLLDNLEWSEGFAKRFGLVRVDFDHDRKRTIKASGRWYADWIARHGTLAPAAAHNAMAGLGEEQ